MIPDYETPDIAIRLILRAVSIRTPGGGVAERLNALVLKTSMSVRASQVRILSPPPDFFSQLPLRADDRHNRSKPVGNVELISI